MKIDGKIFFPKWLATENGFNKIEMFCIVFFFYTFVFEINQFNQSNLVSAIIDEWNRKYNSMDHLSYSCLDLFVYVHVDFGLFDLC